VYHAVYKTNYVSTTCTDNLYGLAHLTSHMTYGNNT